MIDAHEHTALAGPSAAEAWRRLDGFAGQARSSEDILIELEQSMLHRLLPIPAPQPSTPRVDAARSQRGS